MNRKEYNEKILDNLKRYLDAHPDQRFGQAMVNLGIVPRIYVTETQRYMSSDIIFHESLETFQNMIITDQDGYIPYD